MTLNQKVKKVTELFDLLDKDLKQFATTTKLHCLVGCGKCCTKPDIEATVLEFLPLAMHYYMNGQAEIMLEKLKAPNSTCHVFVPTNLALGLGSCGNYNYRGLICRLFGMSAAKSRANDLQLYTCVNIKNTQPEEFARTVEQIKITRNVPMVTDYYQRLSSIDFLLASQYYPINEATRKAIEYVLNYYVYRRPPRGMAKAG